MLNAADINQIIATLSYRPGWHITATDDVFEGVQVRILATVPDSYHDGEMVTLGITSFLSPNDRQSVQSFLAWLAFRLHRIESHEAREFLRGLDGRPLFDPHAAAPAIQVGV